MFFVAVWSKLTQSCMWILSCKHTHLFEMMYHLYFRRYVDFVLQTYCNWIVDDRIFALIFWEKKNTYFSELIELILLKLISPSEIIFTNDEHFFLRILVTIYVFFVLTSMLYRLCVHRIIKVHSILHQKFALWTIYSHFRHEVSLLCFSRNNLLRVLTYVCRHCNIKCF